jgi:hypothetical protein
MVIRWTLVLPIIMSCFIRGSSLGLDRLNVVAFGAIGDGLFLNTNAIVSTIQRAKSMGGGIVFFPNYIGPKQTIFITGAFNLSSNIYLEIEKGVILKGSNNPQDYPCVLSPTWDTGRCHYPLIGGFNIENTGIIGEGEIDAGANSPPGHWVSSYDQENNFLIPMDIPLPSCVVGSGSCRVKAIVFQKVSGLLFEKISISNRCLFFFNNTITYNLFSVHCGRPC